jgi:hypothetical protein
MTPGEVVRLASSKAKIRKLEAQEKASYDYILANLIVKGVSITLGGKGDYPTLQEAYPNLFDEIAKSKEDEIQERKNTLSALRFKQFAQSFNRRFQDKEVPKTINE